MLPTQTIQQGNTHNNYDYKPYRDNNDNDHYNVVTIVLVFILTLFVKALPHSVFNFDSIALSKSNEALFPSNNRLAKSFL